MQFGCAVSCQLCITDLIMGQNAGVDSECDQHTNTSTADIHTHTKNSIQVFLHYWRCVQELKLLRARKWVRQCMLQHKHYWFYQGQPLLNNSTPSSVVQHILLLNEHSLGCEESCRALISFFKRAILSFTGSLIHKHCHYQTHMPPYILSSMCTYTHSGPAMLPVSLIALQFPNE